MVSATSSVDTHLNFRIYREEMNNANLNDPSISRFNQYQPYSSVALFGLNPIATNANSNFFVRLSLIKGRESLVLQQYTVAWTEVQVTVNNLPRNGYIDVSPSCGVALVTPFTFIAGILFLFVSSMQS